MAHTLSRETIQTLDAIAGILLRCFILTAVASIFVWAVYFAIGDSLHRIYTLFIDISRKEFDLFLLYSLTFIKSLNIVFFLIPFVAIKLFLRGKRIEEIT